jgi:hypothetical protein
MTCFRPLAPCFGYPVPLLFPDVEPDILARERASDIAPLPDHLRRAFRQAAVRLRPRGDQRASQAAPSAIVTTVSGAPTTK